MTDTTDIKALREACEILNDHGYLTKSGKVRSSNLAEAVRMIIEQSVGYAEQIEAEHQRAEDITVSRDAMTDKRDTALAKVYELEAEILKLKGDQVPVAVVGLNDSLTVAEIIGDMPRRKAVRELYEGALVVGQELFTTPQKLVVLPSEDCQSCDRHYVDGMRAGWNFHEEGDNQGFIDSIERVQKDMREARNGRVKNDA